MRPPWLAGLALGTCLGGCGGSLPVPADAAPLKCSLIAEVTFRWIGRGSAGETHRLLPTALYEKTKTDGPPCQRQVPDCDAAEGPVDLGDLNRVLNLPAVVGSWPGTGERVFTFESANAEAPTFEVETSGRGKIVVSPHCDSSGCVPPPSDVEELSRTLGRLVTQLACP